MATTQPSKRGASHARNVHKVAAPRNRSEKILTRGASAWDSPNKKLNPNTSYFRTLHKRERTLRWYTTVTFWLALPLVAVAAVMYIQAKTEPPLNLSSVSVPANASDGKETAYAELTSWLAEEYSPLPGATIVSWDGYTFEDSPEPEKSTDEKLPYRFETHQFTLANDGGAYQATVQVAVSDSVGAVATSTPSYVPIPITESLPGGEPVSWFDLDSTSAPESVRPAISDWAEAFTSGDADALRRAVADPTASNVYVPLTGVSELVDVTVIDAAYLPDPDAAADATLDESNLGMVVRVEVSMWWDGQDRGKENSTPRPAPTTYDVLIQEPNTASPRVVAWGAAGSGSKLTPYENAITGVTKNDLVHPDSDDEGQAQDESTPAPTPSPTPKETEDTP